LAQQPTGSNTVSAVGGPVSTVAPWRAPAAPKKSFLVLAKLGAPEGRLPLQPVVVVARVWAVRLLERLPVRL
jgi:hypothetical protein